MIKLFNNQKLSCDEEYSIGSVNFTRLRSLLRKIPKEANNLP